MPALRNFGEVTFTVVAVNEDSIGQDFLTFTDVGNLFRNRRILV
jgi:hypothetical protein